MKFRNITFKLLVISTALAIFGALFCYSISEHRHPKGLAANADHPPRKERAVLGDTLPSTKVRSRPRNEAEAINPDSARRLIDSFDSRNQDITERSRFAANLIKQLCENGFSREAFKLIDEGHGQIRKWQLSTYFEHANLPDRELLDMMTGLDFRSGKHVAFIGFVARCKPEQLAAMISSSDVQEFLKFSKFSLDATSIALSTSLQSALAMVDKNHIDSILKVAEDLRGKGLLTPSDLVVIANHFNAGDAFSRWSLVESITSGAGVSDDVIAQKNQVLAAMVRADAPKAISKILESGDRAESDVGVIIDNWATIDSSGAAKWYQTNRATLSTQNRGFVAAAFSSIAMRSLDFDSARLWTAEVEDPKKQASIYQMIDAKEAEDNKANSN